MYIHMDIYMHVCIYIDRYIHPNHPLPPSIWRPDAGMYAYMHIHTLTNKHISIYLYPKGFDPGGALIDLYMYMAIHLNKSI